MESLYVWPDQPFFSLSVLVVITMTFLYFARKPMHRALDSLQEGVSSGLGRAADWSQKLASELREQDRKVLLESGIAQAENRVAHETARLESSYTKRLSAYPELHLKLDENVTRIDTDYKECGLVAPEVPGWGEVVESLTRVQDSAKDRMIEKMLADIQKSAVAGEKKALREYRSETAKRHKVLGSMAPTWQRLEKLMQQVQKSVSSVLETTREVDSYMSKYEELRSGGDRSAAVLAAKATKLFIFSAIVIVVAAGGAFINFQLIALPRPWLWNSGGDDGDDDGSIDR